MTRLQLVGKNLLRNRRRTLLTTSSVAVFFFLLTLLSATYGFIVGAGMDDRTAQILIVASRVSPSQVPVPISYWDRIARVPGVDAVSPFVTFDAYYGGEDTFMVAFPCAPEVIFKIFNNWQVPEEQRQAYVKEKTALIAGRRVAKKHGWKVGDHIPLRSPGHKVTLDLVLRAIYTVEKGDEDVLSFHWDYFNDARTDGTQGAVYWVITESPEDVPRVMKEIDAIFRNAPVETQTQTMMQFSLNFLAGLGRAKLILLSVSGAVVFAVLLIVANTMTMSIRERTVELAVLRALGFRTSQVISLLTAESLGISLTGAMAGCLMAWSVLKLIAGYRIGGWIPATIPVSVPMVSIVLCVALAISLASTLLPAYRASRISIAQALRYVG